MISGNYSASAVKHAFWFMEFRKVVSLRSEGKTWEEIKKLNEESGDAETVRIGSNHGKR